MVVDKVNDMLCKLYCFQEELTRGLYTPSSEEKSVLLSLIAFCSEFELKCPRERDFLHEIKQQESGCISRVDIVYDAFLNIVAHLVSRSTFLWGHTHMSSHEQTRHILCSFLQSCNGVLQTLLRRCTIPKKIS